MRSCRACTVLDLGSCRCPSDVIVRREIPASAQTHVPGWRAATYAPGPDDPGYAVDLQGHFVVGPEVQPRR